MLPLTKKKDKTGTIRFSVQVYPQSWRWTVLAFNLLFVVGTALFVGALLLTWRNERRGSSHLEESSRTGSRSGRQGPLSTVQEGMTPRSLGSSRSASATGFSCEP